MNDDDDIARMISNRRNRQQLGYYYYEGSHRQPKVTQTPRRNPSRAGQPNWRHRSNKPGWLAAELDILEHTLSFAHAGLDVRGVA